MTKKKKIIVAIVLILILAGLSVGIFFVVKDNKIKAKEEALRNIPFLEMSSETIDSLYNATPKEVLNSYQTIFSSAGDSICKNQLGKSGFYKIDGGDLNKITQQLRALQNDSIRNNQDFVLNLKPYFGSDFSVEHALLDIDFFQNFLVDIKNQTGIQMFQLPINSKQMEDLNEELVLSNLDSLTKKLMENDILLSSNEGAFYDKLPFSFVAKKVDSTHFKEKQVQFPSTHIFNKCMDVSSVSSELSQNTIRQIIAVKKWLSDRPVELDTLKKDVQAKANYLQTRLLKRSFVLTPGDHSLTREDKVYAYVNGDDKNVIKEFKKYKKSVRFISRKELNGFSKPLLIVNINKADSAFISDVNSTKKAIFYDLNNTNNISIPRVVSVSKKNSKYVFRALAGGGDILTSKLFKAENEQTKRQFLTYDKAINVGLNPDSLRQINYLINRALGGRAFPGCEVLIVKDGDIVFEKYYGKPAYTSSTPIDNNDVYDIASMTKVVATTMIGMKLYEEGHFKLDDPIKKYISDTIVKYLPYKKHTIANITFRELLIHKSGLPSGAPIIQYLDYIKRKKLQERFDAYYCDEKDDSLYTVEIAEGMFMDREYQDSMWIKLNSMFLHPNKPYKYSDVNMNLLYRLFKSMIETNKLVKKNKNDSLFNGFNQYYKEKILSPLELKNTMYMPRRHKSLDNIVPTENDRFWRKQLVHGYVHDPSAALLGGIGGNAGIFSNISDLAVMFQMLEQGGRYKGTEILKPETIKLFTSTQANSHRGLGFNKPNLTGSTFGICDDASKNTYGHTGFTGTCFWVDPDKDLIYIFLSNRVHPKVNKRIYQYGVRKGIHNIIYKSMLD